MQIKNSFTETVPLSLNKQMIIEFVLTTILDITFLKQLSVTIPGLNFINPPERRRSIKGSEGVGLRERVQTIEWYLPKFYGVST